MFSQPTFSHGRKRRNLRSLPPALINVDAVTLEQVAQRIAVVLRLAPTHYLD